MVKLYSDPAAARHGPGPGGPDAAGSALGNEVAHDTALWKLSERRPVPARRKGLDGYGGNHGARGSGQAARDKFLGWMA